MTAPSKRTDHVVDSAGVARLTYTVEELAEVFGLSRGITYASLRDGTIPAERVGRRWVISRRRLHAWLDGLPVT
ncbi:MAG: excisionase family DNA-binding protein [Pseudonocardia sp.]